MTHPALHPRRDDHGRTVALERPHAPSPLSTWTDPAAAATAVPDQAPPPAVNGLAFTPWAPPADDAGWEALAGDGAGDPPFTPVRGHATAGAVVLEPDGRVWLVSPSNGFGGYAHTFPKGHPHRGASLRATALKETFEETGLAVRLGPVLVDLERTTSTTRLYLAERTGGEPGAMGWESQAVHLVPLADLADWADHPRDRPVLQALARLRNGRP